jgi:hypothetical protein
MLGRVYTRRGGLHFNAIWEMMPTTARRQESVRFETGGIPVGRVFNPSVSAHHALDGLKTRPTEYGAASRSSAAY